MCENTRVDRIMNEEIRNIVKVAPIEDMIRETRLKRLGHVKRRSVDSP